MKRYKILVGTLIITLGGLVVYTTVLTSYYEGVISGLELDYDNFKDVIEVQTENLIQVKDAEIDKLNLTLETTFKDYTVIETLLHEDMKEWTVDKVLGMREKLDLLPYGSWFAGGHYVTAPWGSTLLIGSHWGSSGHKGVDIKPLSGNNYEPILSAISGYVVTWGRNDRLFGNYMVIESTDGQFQMKLAHLSSMAVFKDDGSYDLYEGMPFNAGDRIARMGNTGHTTGPHLHIEYYILEDNNWRLLNASAILDYIGE